jgi:predicted nucleotidyltransferase
MRLNTIINNLKSKSLASLIPQELVAVYLYGSSAKGRLREESDVDIAILSSPKIAQEERLVLMSKIEGIIDKNLREKGIQREISVLDLREKFVPLTLQYRVITEGILLYERDPFERLEFENTVKGEYFDFVPYLQYLRKKKYGHLLPKI